MLLIELQQGSDAPFKKASQMSALHQASIYQNLHASAACADGMTILVRTGNAWALSKKSGHTVMMVTRLLRAMTTVQSKQRAVCDLSMIEAFLRTSASAAATSYRPYCQLCHYQGSSACAKIWMTLSRPCHSLDAVRRTSGTQPPFSHLSSSTCCDNGSGSHPLLCSHLARQEHHVKQKVVSSPDDIASAG